MDIYINACCLGPCQIISDMLNYDQVQVSWSDRQFIIRHHIKQSIIHNRSTRNLIIRNINPNITPNLIRKHLEHIHNLVLIDINIDSKARVAYINTNSVHNAMFARTCMRSRAAYRGMSINFDVDECAAPWDTPTPTTTTTSTIASVSRQLPPSSSSNQIPPVSKTTPYHHQPRRAAGAVQQHNRNNSFSISTGSSSNPYGILARNSQDESDESSFV